MFKTWHQSLNLRSKLQLVTGVACLACLAFLGAAQVWQHFEQVEAERLDANFRISEAIAGPLSTVLPLRDESAIYGFMEVFDRDPMASGVVIVKGREVIKSQQSLDHPDMPTERLNTLALGVASHSKHQVIREANFQLIGIPVKDSAGRTIGALGVAWNTATLFESVWKDILALLCTTLLICVLLVWLLGLAIGRWITTPIGAIARAMDPLTQDTNGAGALRYLGREDEIGTLARAIRRFGDADKRVRLLSALTSDGVILHSNGVVRDLNLSAARILDCDAAAVQGRQLSDLTRCGGLGPEYASEGIRELVLISGTQACVEIKSTSATLEGETVSAIAFRDVTDLSKAIFERQRAEAASQAKSRFLAVMSHEMRTPLNGIIGMTGMLKKTELNERQKNLVGPIYSSSQSLLTIINDVLDLSRIEAGKVVLQQAEFDPSACFAGTLTLFSAQAADKGLSLNLTMTGNIPNLVNGDENRLRQVCVNLIGNALKFTRMGGVTLEVSAEVVSAGKVRLSVSCADTGIGIAPAAIERLFKPFAQADSSISRQFGGTGLGLSIARHLVMLMGGEIGIASREGEGTRVTFHVVLDAAETQDQTAKNITGWEGAYLRFGGHVLVAEDNPVNVEVMRFHLEALGCTYVIVGNGADAIAALDAEDFNIVLMDSQMPVMDGITATRRIRRRETETGRARIPIIAVTANTFESDRQDARNAGSDDFLSKPFEEHDLAAVLAKWMLQSAALSRAADAMKARAIDEESSAA